MNCSPIRLLALFGVAASLALPPAAAARDNFLIIVADDLGVDMIGQYSDDLAYGHAGEGASPGPTPRIDALAQQGVLFRNAYTNSKCSPSRAQILTGRHALRTGIGQPGGADLALSETTLPELVAATHHSAAIGKWHLGGNDSDHPIDSGFDYYAGALSNLGAGGYYDWEKVVNEAGGSASVLSNHSVYVTDDNSAEAIAKIAEFGEDPWIIYLAFTAPHTPFHVPTAPLTTAVDAGSSNRMKYIAAIEAMDREIGDVIDSIPAGVLADTTIIFIGDNGTPRGVTELPFISTQAKSTVFDGGINVPLIITGPHATAGQESLAFVQSTDIFATIADILGLTSTAEDSLSVRPYLADPSLPTKSVRPYAYAEQFSPNGLGTPYTDHRKAIRTDQYKLIWRNDVFEEFHDITTHPFENGNLLPYAGMTEAQQSAYDQMVQQMNAVETAGLVSCPTHTDLACTTGYLKAKLDWKDKGGFADRVVVNLTKGPALDQSDFGDPTAVDGSGQSVCVYDDADDLVAEMRVVRGGDLCAGKDCWRSIGGDPPNGRGFKYQDKLLASGGALKLLLRNGATNKSKLVFVGRGPHLPDGVTEALVDSASATVQVRGNDMVDCLSATVTDIKKQETDRFKALGG